LSTKNPPRRKLVPHLCGVRRCRNGLRSPAAYLTSLLLALPFFALAASARQTPQNPSATPTPQTRVRPRTVNPTPPAAQATPAATPPASPPATTNAADADKGIAEEVDEDDVVRVDSNLVIVPATVVDNRGRAITDLKLEDFELRVDGQIKPISDLSRAETPVNITLLFDNSASLSTARAFEKQAAVRFFQSLVRPIDRAAVYSISTVPALAQPLTNDVRRLVNTIENFPPPDGATALYDSLAQAAEYVRPMTGRKILVLVSDGTDTVSDTAFDDALNRALQADCQVYVVQTRQIEDPNLRDTFSEQQMQKLTEQTGGAVYAPRSIQELDAAFTQLALDISQQYLLSYYPQDERKDKYFRFISLRVPARPYARVRARKGFYPDGSQGQPPPSAARESRPAGNTPATRRPELAAADARQSPQLQDSLNIRVGEARNASGSSASRSGSRDEGVSNRKIGPSGPDEDEGLRASATQHEVIISSTPAPAERASAPARDVTPTPDPTTTFTPPTPTPSPTPRAEERAAATTTPASAPSELGREKAPVSGGVLNTKALSLPKPTYPTNARNAGVTGTVVVEVMISEEGNVIEARALSGHSLLQAAAVNAARLAKFLPARLSGMPVKVTGSIRYTFVK
jgi:Ca-activated chloride channel family protein